MKKLLSKYRNYLFAVVALVFLSTLQLDIVEGGSIYFQPILGWVTPDQYSGSIQSAINAAQIAGSGTVFVPAGSWNITSPLTIVGSNITLMGAGPGVTIINYTGTSAATAIIELGNGGSNWFSVVSIKDMTLNGNANVANGIYGNCVEQGTFERVDIWNVTTNGILATPMQLMSYKDVIISNNILSAGQPVVTPVHCLNFGSGCTTTDIINLTCQGVSGSGAILTNTGGINFESGTIEAIGGAGIELVTGGYGAFSTGAAFGMEALGGAYIQFDLSPPPGMNIVGNTVYGWNYDWSFSPLWFNSSWDTLPTYFNTGDFPCPYYLGSSFSTGALSTDNLFVSGAIGGDVTGTFWNYASLVHFNSTGNLALVVGYESSMYTQNGSGTATWVMDFLADGGVASGMTITNWAKFYASNPNGGTNKYGFYCGAISGGTTNYGFYEAGTAPNYFGGGIKLGTTNAGTQALSNGGASVPVASGCRAICTDTTAANPVACSVSGTTLTITGTGSDSINWFCY